jgi:flagellar biosynthesis protein
MNAREFHGRLEQALALTYDDRLPAPYVSAKGRGEVAERIIQCAEDNGVPVVERRELLNALYELEVGDFIPENVYRVVAELLVFVRQISQRGSA